MTMTSGDSKNQRSDIDLKVHPDVLNLMEGRRETLQTRELLDVWKHDRSCNTSRVDHQTADVRYILMHRGGIKSASYIPPTPPNLKKVRVKSGIVSPDKKLSPSVNRYYRQVHSAPVRPRRTVLQQSNVSPNNSRTPPTTPVQMHISSPFAERRLPTSDRQFSALMRSNSPKPRPHLYGKYTSLRDTDKRMKSPGNLQKWKEQVAKNVEVKRAKYSIPVDYKTAFGRSNSVSPASSEESMSGEPEDIQYIRSPSKCESSLNRGSFPIVSQTPVLMRPQYLRSSSHGNRSSRCTYSSRPTSYQTSDRRHYRSHLQSWNV